MGLGLSGGGGLGGPRAFVVFYTGWPEMQNVARHAENLVAFMCSANMPQGEPTCGLAARDAKTIFAPKAPTPACGPTI